MVHLKHIDHNTNSLSRQPNVPSGSSPRPSTSSSTSSVPATSMAPTPSTSTTTTQTTQANPTSGNPYNLNTCRDHMDKWVINLSQTPLTSDQLSLLQKGPNYPITPKYPPIDAYIMATELAASKLPTQEVEEFRSDINRLLKQQQQQHHNNCNPNPAQCRALTQLKQDNTGVVLTADNRVAMVIMDQQDYNNKAQALLQDTNTYKVPPKDPPHNSKTSSSIFSRTSSSQEASASKSTNNFTPLVQAHPNFMAFPKFTKQVPPSDP